MLDFLLLTPGELVTNSGVLSAFAFAVSIIALAYMAGEFFSMPSVKGFAKAEVYELGVSAIVLVIALLLVTPGAVFDRIAIGFVPAGLPADQACMEWKALHGTYNQNSQSYSDGNIAFAQADFFLGCRPEFGRTVLSGLPFVSLPEYQMGGVVLNRVTSGYMSLMHNEMWMGLFSTMGINVVIPIKKIKLDVGVTPFAGLGVLNELNTFLVDFMGLVWSTFSGQKLLLSFIEESAIIVFLPFGLVLRAFPFTRKTGSTVIAVVFAAYFIYPLSILINYNIWEQIDNPQGAPGCFAKGLACTTSDQCCSNQCRAGQCQSVLTDFSEYRSVYSVCSNADPGSFITAQGTIEQDFTDGVNDAYLSANPPTDEHWYTKVWTGIKNGVAGVLNVGNAAATLFRPFVLPTPSDFMRSAMFIVEQAALDIATFGFLAIMFTVLEIVITMTLLKDFALLIGGEPRVLGMSRLV